MVRGLKIWSLSNPGSNQRHFDHWPKGFKGGIREGRIRKKEEDLGSWWTFVLVKQECLLSHKMMVPPLLSQPRELFSFTTFSSLVFAWPLRHRMHIEASLSLWYRHHIYQYERGILVGLGVECRCVWGGEGRLGWRLRGGCMVGVGRVKGVACRITVLQCIAMQ
jgi:hypothetical protein